MSSAGLVKCADRDCPARDRCWRYLAPDTGAEQWWRDYHRPEGAVRCGGFVSEQGGEPEAVRPDAVVTDVEPASARPRPPRRPRRRPPWRRHRRSRLRSWQPLIALAPVGLLVVVGLFGRMVADVTDSGILGLAAGIAGGLLTVAVAAVVLFRWLLRH